MRATVLAQPAPPSQPLPPEVTEPLDQLLGFGMWIVGAVLVTSLIVAGGMFVVALRHLDTVDPDRAQDPVDLRRRDRRQLGGRARGLRSLITQSESETLI